MSEFDPPIDDLDEKQKSFISTLSLIIDPNKSDMYQGIINYIIAQFRFINHYEKSLEFCQSALINIEAMRCRKKQVLLTDKQCECLPLSSVVRPEGWDENTWIQKTEIGWLDEKTYTDHFIKPSPVNNLVLRYGYQSEQDKIEANEFLEIPEEVLGLANIAVNWDEPQTARMAKYIVDLHTFRENLFKDGAKMPTGT
jgi:hypothetical protein